MANNSILFKKGSYSDFQKNIVTGSKAQAGALYLTEDEGCLYLGVDGGKVKRIQGSIVFYENLGAFSESVQPPYSQDVIYFIADKGALVRWNASKVWVNADGQSVTGGWDQLNTNYNAEIADLQAQINSKTTLDAVEDLIESLAHATQGDLAALKGENTDKLFKDDGSFQDLTVYALAKAADELYDKYAAVNGELGRITDIEGRLNDIDGTGGALEVLDEAVKTAQKRADDAYDLGDKALPKAGGTMSGNIDMDDNYSIVGLKDVDNDSTSAVTRGYVDGQLTDINGALAGKLSLTGGEMAGDINMATHTVTGLKDPVKESDAVTLAYLNGVIADVVSASDALVFKGILNAASDLPESGDVGDTYKVGTNGVYRSITAKVGDLIVCIPDGEGVKWDLIPSGDELSYVQQMLASGDTIYLTNGIDDGLSGAKGGFKFKSTCDNLAFTIKDLVSGSTIREIEVGLSWGTF